MVVRAHRACLASAACAACLAALPAAAQDLGNGVPTDDFTPPLAVLPTPEDALIDPAMRRSWAVAPARLFLATTVDVGYVYLRPRASVGWGKPFTSWIGVDANPVVGGAGVGAYGGLRLALPWVDLRVGPRYFMSFQRRYLAPQESYSRLDLDSTFGSQARTVTYEAELTASLRAGPGDLHALASGSYLTGAPNGQYVFEETLRVIVLAPLVWRARVGYSIRLGDHGQHSIGLVAEVLDVPKRDDSLTFRAGPVLRMVLSRRVEVRGSFVVTVKSPDQIGLGGGDFTELGVRYRWATEPDGPGSP